MCGIPGQASGYYTRTAAHRARLSEGAVRSWKDPEIRRRRLEAKLLAYDDPLYLALLRARKRKPK